MPDKRITPRRITLVYLFWWVQWTIMQTVIIHHYGFSWSIASIDSLLTNFLLTGVMFTINNIMRYYQPFGKNIQMGLLWNICIALLCVLLFNYIQGYFFASDLTYMNFVKSTLLVRFCFALLLITCSTMISWIWRQLVDLKEAEIRKSEIEQLAKESELMRIRQQLQPHFLFNSLNSISALTGSKPEEARKMIQQLSDFLRGTLRKDDQQLTSLEEELKHLQLYLDIEKVRFGHRLNVQIVSTEKEALWQMPVLLLQPIVENAIKFGLYDTLGETAITINTTTESHYLKIEVSNPFDGTSIKPTRGTGYGLSSVERRLYLLYGRNDLLVTKMEAGLFITSIKIPQSL